ncbi:MAG: DUF1552 domain-containing protein [Lentisphaeraceae bacterium]|nr:DUF1552 domain-containing protein [Lentisphaeraceae bacterium]
MNRRDILRAGLTIPLIANQSLSAIGKSNFQKVNLQKNIVLVTVDLGLYEKGFRTSDKSSQYFHKIFSEFEGESSYFSGMHQPGLGGGHEAEHATFTCMKFTDREMFPDRQFISLDQHIAENSEQSTRHKFIYHKITGNAKNVSFNSLAQPTPSLKGISELHDELFGKIDIVALKQRILKQQFIIKELYNNTKRRWLGNSEQKNLADSLAYKVEELETRLKWLKVKRSRKSAKFKQNQVSSSPLNHAEKNFDIIFEALKENQTRIATVQFGGQLTKGIHSINHGYHTLSHHAYYSERVTQLQTLDFLVLKALKSFLQKLKDSKLLDETIVLFTCAMGDANKHSSKNIPAFLFGGDFKHNDFIKCTNSNGSLAYPTSALYSSILKQAGFQDHSFSGNNQIIKELF